MTGMIGIMTGMSVEREYEIDNGKTKMNVIEIDSNGLAWFFFSVFFFKCILWHLINFCIIFVNFE